MYLLSKYVDDVDIATGLIPKGWKWSMKGGQSQLEYSEAQREVSESQGKMDTARTMDLIVQEGSRLIQDIWFTSDLPENNQNGRYPVLDLEAWADHSEEGRAARIRHSFFDKEVAAPKVFHSKAAYT